jgi:phosphatidyl-myo-inositol dimannoside synthase
LGVGHRPLLLTVGNVTDRKGQDIVIRSLPSIVQAGQDVHFVMAGLPTNRESLTGLAESLGVMNRVHFLGRVDLDTLVTAYNACDVYVMTSKHDSHGDFEGYGIAAVEAAFCAKPSVVSSGSGLEEAVLHGQTGLVVPEQDPEATAHAITQLLQDEPLRATLGRQARERALREQTWHNRAVQYDQFLHGLVDK